MSIFRMLKTTGQIQDPPGKRVDPVERYAAAHPDEEIELDAAEDLAAVRALVHVLQDNPDEARQIVRSLSPADRAVLQFHLRELSRITDEEDSFRETEDRRRARLSYGDRPGAVPDSIGPFEIG
jgi:hypothetical protein